jgi:hypothetical protein
LSFSGRALSTAVTAVSDHVQLQSCPQTFSSP